MYSMRMRIEVLTLCVLREAELNPVERKSTIVFDGLWVIFPQCQTRCFSAEVGSSSPTSHSVAMETWALPTHRHTRCKLRKVLYIRGKAFY
ncbi:hypothetical protein ACB092_11G039400 [Castanea dentata]